MLYLTCTTISIVDLAEYGVSLVKDWVSEECGTSILMHYKDVLILIPKNIPFSH